MTLRCLAVLAVLVVGLTGCGASDEREAHEKKRSPVPADAKAERDRLMDKSYGPEELAKRMHARISVADGMFLINTGNVVLSQIPTTAIWTMDCDVSGLRVQIPPATPPETEDSDGGLQISNGWFSYDDCKVLAPDFARIMKQIIAGN